MKRVLAWLAATMSIICIGARASEPMPLVDGEALSWPAVAAAAINVHRGDGSYIESLPGDAISWTAPAPGDYYLVAADERDWREWSRSRTVTVEEDVSGDAPMPLVEGDRLRWAAVAAVSINVHRRDGSYIESLPGDATSWTAPAPGDYYLVAADEGDWRGWPRSEVVTVEEGAVADAPAPTVEGSRLLWPAVSAVSINVHKGDGSYVESLPGGATSWTAPEGGTYYLVAADAGDWRGWPRSPSVTVVVAAEDDPSPDMPVIDRDNHVELLAQVFGVYVGDVIGEPIRFIRHAALSQTGGDSGYGTVPAEYACMNGGTVRVEAEDVFVFDECQILELVHDGRIEAPFERYGWVAISDGLSIRTEPDRSIGFSGTAYRAFSSTNRDSIGTWQTTDVDFRAIDASGTFAIENADTAFSFGRFPGGFRGELEGGFTIRSPLTGDRAVHVMTTEAFDYPDEDSPTADERNFTSGVLKLSAADGNLLVFDVGNGDEDSVSIALSVDGETEEFTQPWSLWPDVRYED